MSYNFMVLVFAAVQNNLTYLYQIQLPGSAGVEVCVLYVWMLCVWLSAQVHSSID